MDFLNHLVQLGFISKEEVQSVFNSAVEKYGGNVDQVLLDRGLTDEQLITLKSQFFNVPFRHVEPKDVPFETLKLIPEESAKYYTIAPIGSKGSVLEVGMVDPGNMQAMDAIQFIASRLGMTYQYFLISRSDFEGIIQTYKNVTGEVTEALSEFEDGSLVAIDDPALLRKQEAGAKEDLNKIVEDAPIIRIVSSIIRDAVEKEASDIHIENTGEQVKVRFRLDGALSTVLTLPMTAYSGVVARVKILSRLRLDEKRKPQDGGFSTQLQGRKIDFRVSTFPTYYGEKVVMRILDSEKGVKPLDSLHFSEANMKKVRSALDRPYGIILITGPTGSGKSTTLFSMLNELDRETENVVSLEDPVEYHMPGVSQSQVMPEIGYTFASGLRSILRQDPDIIMVGEIRDKETAQLAIQAALTGHMVFSTLHTNTATGAIPRLIDMGVDPYLIAPTLILAMGQRLVRMIVPECKVEVPIDESTRQLIEKQFEDLPKEFKQDLPINQKVMYTVKGNDEHPSGYKGRMAVFEMLPIDKDLEKIILTNPVEPEIYKAARAKGMMTLREDAIIKALEGLTTFQEAFAV
jgi:type IV pilus assembly protein PilB